jgi:N-acyl-D-aspartate/D-glutamate deacylase
VNERPFSLSATATIGRPQAYWGYIDKITVLLRRLRRTECDLLIRAGTIYDGRGGSPIAGDVAIVGDRIVAVGRLQGWRGVDELDARDKAVSPGFVNMLSWANESLLEDGRAQSDLRQGVTLEVLGEGTSMGPLTEAMKEEFAAQSLFGLRAEWTTLGEFLDYVVEHGVAPNVASFVGAETVRVHELGSEDRPPGEEELNRMEALVRQAMEEGAVGVSSALVYAPGFYAETAELVALARAAAGYGGMYISHLRSEGNQLLEGLEELLTIAREAEVRAEIYHLKAAGTSNWGKLERAIERVEEARREGLSVTADMYTYKAGATGLNGAMPPWVQEGGFEAWRSRLSNPDVRARVEQEMTTDTDEWENMFLLAGPENMRLLAFRNDRLRPLTGLTLAELAAQRGTSPARTAMDLVVEDGSRVSTAYFTMSEENLRRELQLPWVSFCSDSAAPTADGVFRTWSTHPRAYGSFARLLGKYVRDEGVVSLEAAIHRLTELPARNLGLADRGLVEQGFYADLVVFDPDRIQDHATFDDPHRYASGVSEVVVNGTLALRDGEPTGELPGRVVRGPGWGAR